MKPHLLGVIGARPNFIKMQALWPAFKKMGACDLTLVHTSQHHDWELSQQFLHFSQLQPDFFLPINPEHDSQARFGSIMQNFSKLLRQVKPHAVLVIGDVDSTLACALVAAKSEIPIIHVEAGLRCFDRSLPEEINRVLVDQLSSVLFITEDSAKINLLKEGVSEKKIHFVGNVLIDSFYQSLAHALSLPELNNQGFLDVVLKEKAYFLITLHRRSLIHSTQTLSECLNQLINLSTQWPVVWPIHPHTYQQLEERKLLSRLTGRGIHLIQPVNYLQMLSLMKHALAVITDSGGLQEETTVMNIPCFTLRPNTERPITVLRGTNCLIPQVSRLYEQVMTELQSPKQSQSAIPLWDGKAAFRIAEVSVSWMQQEFLSLKRPGLRYAECPND